MNSTYKDNATLVYTEDRERLQLLGRQVLRRVMNEAIEALWCAHADNQTQGRVESLLTTQEEVEQLLFNTVQKQLGPGADVHG